jgi:hypothetical protein
LPDKGTLAIDPTQLQRAREIFEAVAPEQGAAREALLDRSCLGDTQLRACVERMILADAKAYPLLDQPLGLAGEDDDAALQPGTRVGQYRILREIGAGGMGAVYQAESVETPGSGPVAIKVIRWYSHDVTRRFRQEQLILSGLHYPNIARLLDSGMTDDGSPYFVMEYVDGQALPAYCDERKLSTSDRIRLFRQVCAAVVYMHQNLVVHRDLKPGNVLVTVDGVVKLVDFGIAKLLQSDAGLFTHATTLAGMMTPNYASPEQIRGAATSTLTDVYSLGVVLYELLTGVRPFMGPPDRVHETLRRICEEEPRKPSVAASSRELRGELDTIVLKAIRKEPERRYASVEQFDEDLRRYLARQPVLAQGDSVAYRTRKFILRYKGAVAAAAAMAVLLCGGIISTSFEVGVARRERSRAEAQQRAAEQGRAEANRQRILADQHAREADLQRASAERRLGELQKLANGVVRIYHAQNGNAPDAAALIAENVRDSLIVLGRETRLEPGLVDILDRASATIRSHRLANESSWQVPAGWIAAESKPGEYRVGVDHRIVHSGKSSLFVRSLVANPSGTVAVSQRFSARLFRSRRVRLSGFLRTERIASDVMLGAAFVTANGSGWDPARVRASGTTPWKKYELVVDVPQSADFISIQLELWGSGTFWADDLSFEPVGASVPVTVMPPRNLNFKQR